MLTPIRLSPCYSYHLTNACREAKIARINVSLCGVFLCVAVLCGALLCRDYNEIFQCVEKDSSA